MQILGGYQSHKQHGRVIINSKCHHENWCLRHWQMMACCERETQAVQGIELTATILQDTCIPRINHIHHDKPCKASANVGKIGCRQAWPHDCVSCSFLTQSLGGSRILGSRLKQIKFVCIEGGPEFEHAEHDLRIAGPSLLRRRLR